MKIKLQIFKRLAVVIVAMLAALHASAWDQMGHDVTAEIARRHLTPTTAAAIDMIFGGTGEDIVYGANWLENASYRAPYTYTSWWHYLNVDAGETLATVKRNPRGDLLTGIMRTSDELFDPGLSDDERAASLRMLVHLVADLHQPLHCGHNTDNGGSNIYVKYFGYSRSLHSVWDYSMVETGHDWSYREWADQIDRIDEATASAIIAGTPEDWAVENIALAAEVYAAFPSGCTVSFDELAAWLPTIESRFVKGGYRLAHLLNTLFDPAYAPGSASSPLIEDNTIPTDNNLPLYDLNGRRRDPSSSLPAGIYVTPAGKLQR